MPNAALPALPTDLAGTVVSSLLAIQLRNLRAMAQAQRATVEGLGLLARQQREMLVASLEAAGRLSAGPPDPDPRSVLAWPFDATKRALLDGTAQRNLLGELAARAGATVADILQARMVAALEETKAALMLALPAR